MSTKTTFVSLFSGCGGLDTGFIESGFQCKSALDIDDKVIDVHRMNLGDSGKVADIRETTKEHLMANGKPTIIVSGSPCQGFSTVGKRDLHDPRNSLLLQAGRLAVEVMPKVFVAENVSGVLAGEHKIYWEHLDQMLRAARYKTKTVKLNAADLGLAQSRSRIFMIAWKSDRVPVFDFNTCKPKTLRDILSDVEGLPQHDKEFLRPDSVHHMIAQRIRQGQKLCNVRGGDASVHTWDIPEVYGKTTATERAVLLEIMKLRRSERARDYGDADPVALRSLEREIGGSAKAVVNKLITKGYMKKVGSKFDLVNTFNGKYRRLGLGSISLTVDTRFGDPRYFLHPTEQRGFTVREAARIQGFPDWFKFSEKSADNYRMIGNAVPPPMAKYVAEGIRSVLN